MSCCSDFFGPAQSKRHYGCFMPACRIPLKRLMPSSLSQPRTRYPPAGCTDLVNEFISLVAMAYSASPHSGKRGLSIQWESTVTHRGLIATSLYLTTIKLLYQNDDFSKTIYVFFTEPYSHCRQKRNLQFLLEKTY